LTLSASNAQNKLNAEKPLAIESKRQKVKSLSSPGMPAKTVANGIRTHARTNLRRTLEYEHSNIPALTSSKVS